MREWQQAQDWAASCEPTGREEAEGHWGDAAQRQAEAMAAWADHVEGES